MEVGRWGKWRLGRRGGGHVNGEKRRWKASVGRVNSESVSGGEGGGQINGKDRRGGEGEEGVLQVDAEMKSKLGISVSFVFSSPFISSSTFPFLLIPSSPLCSFVYSYTVTLLS